MELISVSKAIEAKIKLLEIGRGELKVRAERRAEAQSFYEKQLAITMVELKNGKEFHWEGQTIKDPPTTILEKIARGLCWRQKLEADKAESFYKNAIVGLQTIQNELGGYQSIYKHLSEI